ncbi:MAG TPA: hypothetical protein VIG99_23925 [Myxococcaceae bacterium]|jgi:hypothetical protein
MHALTLAVLMMVSGAPDSPDVPQFKIAMPGLDGVRLEDREAQFFTEYLDQQLTEAGALVTTDREISAVLGLERRRQLLGCSDSGQCMIELGGALGVDALLLGSVARLQTRYQVNVKLISVKNAELLASESQGADNDEQLLEEINGIARRVARRGAEKVSRSLVPERIRDLKAPGLQSPVLVAAIGIVGAAAAGFGGYAYTQADARYQQLLVATDTAHAIQLRDEGLTWRTGTYLGFGAGGVLITAAVAAFIVGNTPVAPKVAIAPAPGSLGVALEWRWP